MKKLIMDLDNTLTIAGTGDYQSVQPNTEVIEQLRSYQRQGFEIIIHTARNMRTHHGNLGKITKHTVPIILDWLKQHNVPFDELVVGKPWCGTEGFYVDDRAIRPSEFASMTYAEIRDLLKQENKC